MQGVDFIVKYYIIYLSNYQLAISQRFIISHIGRHFMCIIISNINFTAGIFLQSKAALKMTNFEIAT